MATDPHRSTRLPALDRLRAAALLAMLVHHLTDWYVGGARALLPGWSGLAVTDVAAPAFFVAAGAAVALFATSRRRRAGRGRLAVELARRYGLLVPIGVALRWALWDDPLGFGVLECLGLVTVATAVVALAAPRALAPAAVAALLVGPSAAAVAADGSWLEVEVLAGTFPLATYLGFSLLGGWAVASGALRRPRIVLAVGLGLLAATAVMALGGEVPERYPGGLRFVVPGIGATAVVYGLAGLRHGGGPKALDALLRRVGAHTLGIFLAHYGVYVALLLTGTLRTLSPAVGIPAALATAGAFAVAAAHVPPLPWSPRTGRRAPAPVPVAG